jgi:hypothetical protein
MNKAKRKDLFEAEILKASQNPQNFYDKNDSMADNKKKVTIGGMKYR